MSAATWRSRRLEGLRWRSALGEVVLIVVGILIAMAASDWHDRRVARRTELAALRELRVALSEDVVALEGALERYRALDARIAFLIDHLRSRAPYADSLDASFGAVYGFQTLELNRAAYESLKSRGLDLVSDDALRSRITDVYERVYPRAQAASETEQAVVLDILRPHFLAHFRDLRFGTSATPLDYPRLVADPLFLNLVDYRLQGVRQQHIPRTERGIEGVRALLEAINAEVGTLQ